VECAGHADRSAFDLSHHKAATGVKLVAEKKLTEPKTIQVSSGPLPPALKNYSGK